MATFIPKSHDPSSCFEAADQCAMQNCHNIATGDIKVQMTLKGHPRSSTIVPVDKTYLIFC